ncbi:MAG: hypothetical protein DRH51_04070 [Candidatus Coatesbacteria bacterium]|nr:MAG: hypothetical protein DRH51_04070 [Candidatus Coatesbacteria bacterium]RLC41496.1 MAG: hypothetical protein DRH49_05335 [Candidatus Coatesbacteria bacterium]
MKTKTERRPKPGEKIIFKNRDLYVKYRNKAFSKAIGIKDDIIRRIKSNSGNDIQELYQLLDKLVSVLEDARYCARLSIGGNNIDPPETITVSERAFVDLIETMYSYARSTRRMARHELTLLEFSKSSKKLANNIYNYVKEANESEHNLILKNLQNITDRIELYRKYFPDECKF